MPGLNKQLLGFGPIVAGPVADPGPPAGTGRAANPESLATIFEPVLHPQARGLGALFLTDQHRATVETLLHAIQAGRPVIALSGDPGIGKSTLLHGVLARLRDPAVRVLRMDAPLRFGALRDALGRVAAGSRIVLAIDGAETLPPRILRYLAVKANWRLSVAEGGAVTGPAGALTVVLVGRPALAAALQQSVTSSLAGTAPVVLSLAQFTPEEAVRYVEHRVMLSGYPARQLMASGALRLIAQGSGGLPARADRLLDLSLKHAAEQSEEWITGPVARAAFEEGTGIPTHWLGPRGRKAAVAGLIVAGVVLVYQAMAPSGGPRESATIGIPAPPVVLALPDSTAAPAPAVVARAAPEPPSAASLGAASPDVPLVPRADVTAAAGPIVAVAEDPAPPAAASAVAPAVTSPSATAASAGSADQRAATSDAGPIIAAGTGGADRRTAAPPAAVATAAEPVESPGKTGEPPDAPGPAAPVAARAPASADIGDVQAPVPDATPDSPAQETAAPTASSAPATSAGTPGNAAAPTREADASLVRATASAALADTTATPTGTPAIDPAPAEASAASTGSKAPAIPEAGPKQGSEPAAATLPSEPEPRPSGISAARSEPGDTRANEASLPAVQAQRDDAAPPTAPRNASTPQPSAQSEPTAAVVPAPAVVTARASDPVGPALASVTASAAPASAHAAPAPPILPAGALSKLPETIVATLIRRGEEMRGTGDISAARLLFERAAEAGSATAAAEAGRLRDPAYLARLGAIGVAPDPAAAAAWYRRAAALGDKDSAALLDRLKEAAR